MQSDKTGKIRGEKVRDPRSELTISRREVKSKLKQASVEAG